MGERAFEPLDVIIEDISWCSYPRNKNGRSLKTKNRATA